MVATGGDVGPVGVSADTDGRGATDGGSVAELSVAVVSPAPEGAVGLDAASVGVACGEDDPARRFCCTS